MATRKQHYDFLQATLDRALERLNSAEVRRHEAQIEVDGLDAALTSILRDHPELMEETLR